MEANKILNNLSVSSKLCFNLTLISDIRLQLLARFKVMPRKFETNQNLTILSRYFFYLGYNDGHLQLDLQEIFYLHED